MPAHTIDDVIQQLDKDVPALSWLIRDPGLIGAAAAKTIRIGANGSIPEIIDILR